MRDSAGVLSYISAEREVVIVEYRFQNVDSQAVGFPDYVSAVGAPEASWQQWGDGAWDLAWSLPLPTLRTAALAKAVSPSCPWFVHIP